MLSDLLSQLAANEPIASGEPTNADGAHDGRACRDAVADCGAGAVIAPRHSAKPRKKDSPGAGPRNEALRDIERFG